MTLATEIGLLLVESVSSIGGFFPPPPLTFRSQNYPFPPHLPKDVESMRGERETHFPDCITTSFDSLSSGRKFGSDYWVTFSGQHQEKKGGTLGGLIKCSRKHKKVLPIDPISIQIGLALP